MVDSKWLIDEVLWGDGQLTLVAGSEGMVRIEWDEKNGTPKVTGLADGYHISRNARSYSIELKVKTTPKNKNDDFSSYFNDKTQKTMQ